MTATKGDRDATPGLAGTLRRGAGISAGALVFTQVVTLAQTLALARILSPTEVGLFYAGTVLTMFLVTVAEGGLRSALIQRQHDLDEAATTVFWASLGAGVVLALLALAAAPLVAAVFDSSTAGLIAAVSAGSLVLQALTYVPDALLQRRFDFRQRLIVAPSTAVAFAGSSVLLCALGMGVWGLVVASYVSLVAWIVATWSLARWRPRRHLASVGMFRELARYGMPMVLGSASDKARDILETVLVGNAFGAAAVGNYRYGRRLGVLPGTVVLEIGAYLLFPAFARTAGDPPRFAAAFLRSLQVLWVVAVPTGAMIAAFGQPLTVLLLGEPWREAAIMFAALAGVGPGYALAEVGCEAIKGHGRTTLLNWVNAVELVLGTAALLLLLQLGLLGVGLAISLTSVVTGLVGLLLARMLLGVSWHDLARRLLAPLAVGLVCAVAWTLVERFVGQADDRGVGLGMLVLVGEGVGFLVTYAAGLLLVAPEAVAELRRAVREPR